MRTLEQHAICIWYYAVFVARSMLYMLYIYIYSSMLYVYATATASAGTTYTGAVVRYLYAIYTVVCCVCMQQLYSKRWQHIHHCTTSAGTTYTVVCCVCMQSLYSKRWQHIHHCTASAGTTYKGAAGVKALLRLCRC